MNYQRLVFKYRYMHQCVLLYIIRRFKNQTERTRKKEAARKQRCMVKATEYIVEIFNREIDEYESDSDFSFFRKKTYYWAKQYCIITDETLEEVNCRFGFDFASEDLADWEDLNIEDIFRILDSLGMFSKLRFMVVLTFQHIMKT